MSNLLQDSAGPTEFVSDMVAVGTVEETAIYPQSKPVYKSYCDVISRNSY